MQGWIGGHAPVQTFAAWKKKFGGDPLVFSFDLQGYGTIQFPEWKVVCLAGFSDKTMDLLRMLDGDPRHSSSRADGLASLSFLQPGQNLPRPLKY